MSLILFAVLQSQIERLDETSTIGGERQDALDHCLASISRLTSEVQDAMDFIPAYDQRAYSKVESYYLYNAGD
jgi:hypothetical protein